MASVNRFAVLGDPIEHSLSPAMHNAALAAAGISGMYEAIRISPPQLGACVQKLRRDGFCGFNVTIPHKEAVAAHLDWVSRPAAQLAAVNTVVSRAGRLRGYNTDVSGFRAALRRLGFPLFRGDAVIFGTGGSARAVAFALDRMGARVTVVSRDRLRAERLAERLSHGSALVTTDQETLSASVARAGLLVNATPLGMDHLADLSPLPDTVALSPRATAIDLVYGRATPFLRRAAAEDCRRMDGLEMLVQQGRAAFRLWTGILPDADVMRQACVNRLEEMGRC
jgi:shikimate dehydrogenase